MKILVLNAGSSSQKSCLYDIGSARLPELAPPPIWQATRESNEAGVILSMLETLWGGESPAISGPDAIDIVGHRVVHGGREYRGSTRLTPEVKEVIAQYAPLAPMHNPAALRGIEAATQLLGDTPQVAVFDTAFHSDLPDAAAVYPGPYEWVEQGIRRYGFHGISHEYSARRVASLLGRKLDSLRLITCHLGNGCSLAAIQNGRSVDTTMGFTPLEGLMMGTRSGTVDPGILFYLMREKGCSAESLEELIVNQSGLKGVSGVSGDMRKIATAIEQGDQRAQLAFSIYVHRLRAGIGSMLAALGGIDALVFTGGVGENSAAVRAAACETFKFLGLKLAAEQNEHEVNDRDIADDSSSVRVMVIKAEEDWAIAQQCWKIKTE